jgi:uncharacterized protein YbaR (Trm112 family)
MVDKELLEILACPQTRQALREAPSDCLARLNERIARGEVANQSGTVLRVPLVEGLLREDGRVLYPVLDGIPMLIAEEAIELAGPG